MATLGIRARICVVMAQPCTISLLFANVGPSAPCVQVINNGAIIGEYTSLTAVDVPFNAGFNVLEAVAADGGLFIGGQFVNGLAPTASLYQPGFADPFSFVSGGGGSGPKTSSGGTTA